MNCRKRAWKGLGQMLLLHRRLVVGMAAGGALAGLAVAQAVPKIYYSRTLVEIETDERPMCR